MKSPVESARRRFQAGRISLARPARESGLSIYDMMDELDRRGLGSAIHHTTPGEAREDLARLPWVMNLPGQTPR